MLQITVIGHIGADAHIEANNGKPFVSFNVSHNDRWTDASGVVHESVQWVSCALNGDGGQLLQYLKKGRQVFVQGRCSTRVYSSPTQKMMVAGINCAVDRIELLGGQPDPVPSQLADKDAVVHKIYKAYYIDPAELPALKIKKGGAATLYATNGQQFSVDANGIVIEAPQPQSAS